MAGEWIAYDLSLPAKPEVQELIDETGHPVEVVVYRLLQLWGWASMHCTDGTARMTLARLVRTCGGDDAFWRAVAAVGWLEIDQTAATVAVPGWDRRFSQAAKSRAQQADRSRNYEERHPARKRPQPSDARASDDPTPDRRRGEEMREEVPPPPREASQSAGSGRDAWRTLKDAWNAGTGRKWTPSEPPDGFWERIAEPGWLEEAPPAIARLPKCLFFTTPVTLIQFVQPGFVARVLGEQYDEAKKPKGSPASQDGRKTAAEAATEWQRGAADPETVRRRREFMEAKRRRAAAAGGDDVDQARAAVAGKIKLAEDT
jgi:hypothetical protein